MAKGKDSAHIVRVAKSLSHPLRISILEAVGEGKASPVTYSRDHDESLRFVAQLRDILDRYPTVRGDPS